ncbi:hypothetical protein B6E66_15640, partial [Streptomyces maremycinicus]
SEVTLDPDGSYTVQGADGQISELDLKPGQTVTNPDGSTTTLNADGSITTKYPDGLISTLEPDGTYTVDAPGTGGVDTSSLNPDGSGTSTSSGTGLNSTGTSTGSGLNGALDDLLNGTTSTSGPLTSAAQDGDFLYDDVPYTSSLSGALGGAVPSGDGLTGTSGLNPGALAAASRMGGLNGEMTAADRVRAGYADTDAANGAARTTAARAATTTEQAAARTTTSSGMPFMPPGAGQGSQATQSEARTRSTWLSEDEEIWGTDEDAAPAVLGRDD